MSASTTFVESALGAFRPELGLVLGSGLGFFANEHMEVETIIPYEDIPDFPKSTVEGHAGNLVAGRCGGRQVLCFQGRFHYYEGYAMSEVVKPTRLLGALGARRLILTNAAGGIAEGMTPGDLMLIEDHINFLGVHPLHGPNDPRLGPRFPDMTEVYSAALRRLAAEAAEKLGIALKRGIYLACSGPSYETPAEIRMFQRWGASAVGMSTVPEAIAARHMGLEVLGISCITNLGAGLSGEILNHQEVEQTARRVKATFAGLLEAIIAGLDS